MFHSLRAKLAGLIFLVLALTAFLILFFSNSDIGEAVRNLENKRARSVIKLVDLNVRRVYSSLIEARLNSVNEHKNRLVRFAKGIGSVISGYTGMAENGMTSSEAARQGFLNWISRQDFKNDMLLEVVGADFKVLASSGHVQADRSLQNITDNQGRKLKDVMGFDRVNPDGDFAMFEAESKSGNSDWWVGFFLPFPEFEWTICVSQPFGDVEARATARLEEMVENLKVTFSDIEMGDEGTIFMFSGEGKVLIAPRIACPLNEAVNKLTGHLLRKDLEEAAEKKQKVIFYEVSCPGEEDEIEMAAHCFYFQPLDWYVVVAASLDELEQPVAIILGRQSLLVVGVFVFSVLLGLFLVRRISRPLGELADYAQKLPETDFSLSRPEGAATIFHVTDERDEIGRLARSFVFMEAELRKNVAHLMETTAARERMESELEVARQIQEGILKNIFPPFPERQDFDLYASLTSAKEVGGDLYDFFFVDQNTLCFIVGDVSDKGVPAALFMSIAITLLRSTAARERDAGKIVSLVNNELSRENPNSMFVTLFLGMLDLRTGQLRFVNGGHNPALMLRSGKDPNWLEGLSGPVVGGIEDVKYKELETRLSPGDAIFVYTDGVTEAMDLDLALYGEERLLERVKSVENELPEAVIESVYTDLNIFKGNAPQSDDITMLMIRYKEQAEVNFDKI